MAGAHSCDVGAGRAARPSKAARTTSAQSIRPGLNSFVAATRTHSHPFQDLCAILSGLVVATNYKRGQELIRDRTFADNADFFQVGPGLRGRAGTRGGGQARERDRARMGRLDMRS